MAKKISQLTAATTPLAGTEIVPIVQGGETRQVAVSDLGGSSAVGNANEVQTTDGAGTLQAATRVKAGTDYMSVGDTPATTGNFRLTASGSIYARDVNNTANLGVLALGGLAGAEWVALGTDAGGALANTYKTLYLQAWNLISFDVSTSGVGGFATMYPNGGDSLLQLQGMSLAIGTVANPKASTGAIRLAQDGQIQIRNEANSGDLRVFTKSNLDVLAYGSGASDTWIDSGTGGSFIALADTHRIMSGSGGTEWGRFSSSGFQLNNGPSILTGTGVPASSPGNGSIFLRTDGTSTTGIYTRQAGAWSAVGGSSTSFADNVFEVTDDGDATKKLAFQCSGITTGTTRTLTIPNASGTLPLLSLAQAWSALQSFDSSITLGGGTPSTVGLIRTPYNGGVAQPIISTKTSGAADANILTYGPGHALDMTSPGNGTLSLAGPGGVQIVATGGGHTYYATSHNFYNYTLGGYAAQVTSALWQTAIPRVGLSTAYASEGRAAQAMADANQTLASGVYSRRIVRFTGANTADRTATFPHPASEDASYEKIIVNDCTGAFNVTVSTGTGTTVNVANVTGRAVLAFTPSGVMQIAT